jgi:gluconokinase
VLADGHSRAYEKTMTKLVIMGVSGAGKTTLGLALAQATGWRFMDADDFHTVAAKAKIASGRTLDETDRAAWLAAVAPAFEAGGAAILACSALKDVHRKSLRHDVLVHLVLSQDEALDRLRNRQGHFAGPSIAASQFAILEAPEHAITVPASWTTQAQVDYILDQLKP